MAIDKLINQSQGDDIIDALEAIATNVGGITYGPETSSDKVVSMTGYQKASTAAAISQGDTLNEAVGKLEKKVDDNITTLADKVESHSSETTAGNIATYYNATGTEIDDSGVAIVTTVDDTKDTEVPTSKAMGTYVSGLGYATGVNSSTADNLVTFNSTDGKALKDSGIAVATSTTGVVASADNAVPTSKSVANYVSAQNYAVGADSSVANNLVTFNDATGKALKNSGVAIATSTTGITDADGYVPTSKAVKAYVDSTATGISRYMGTVTATSGLSTSAKKGDFYIVSTAWTGVHVGDEIIAEKDNPAQTIDGTNWTLLHNEADTDTKVTQTETSTNASYEVIFAGSTGSSDKTEGVGKDAGMTYNPSTNALTVTGPISAGSFAGNAVKTNWTGTIDNTTVPGTKLVDDRLTTAETNILYTLGRTGKNLYDIKHPTRAVNITLTDDGNGQFTQSASGAWAAWDYDFDVTVGVQYVVYIKFKSVTTYNAAGACVLKDADGNDIKREAINTPQTLTYTFTAPTSRVRLGVTCNNSSYNQTGTFVMQDPMVVEKAIYDNFPDYQPYAGKQNSDLTYLEAEDRAALIEEIDSGAKNKVDIASVTTTGSNYVFNQLAINALPAGSYVFSYSSTQSDSGDIQLVVTNDSATLASVTITSKSGSNAIEFTINGTATKLTLYSVRAGTYSNFMLCTKAAFGISKAFVPYRPNYDLVCSVNKYEKTNMTFTTDSAITNVFDLENSYAYQYYNAFLGKTIVYMDLLTKASISTLDSKTVAWVKNGTNNTYTFEWIQPVTSGDAVFRFTKPNNTTGLVMRLQSGTVASGVHVYVRFEYDIY